MSSALKTTRYAADESASTHARSHLLGDCIDAAASSSASNVVIAANAPTRARNSRRCFMCVLHRFSIDAPAQHSVGEQFYSRVGVLAPTCSGHTGCGDTLTPIWRPMLFAAPRSSLRDSSFLMRRAGHRDDSRTVDNHRVDTLYL